VVLLFFGVFGCIGASTLILLGAPSSWMRQREVAALPQPQPSELASLAPGTEMLLSAQLPPDAPTSEPHGLALFYVEERARNTPTRQAGEDRSPDSGSRSWERVTPPPAMIEMRLRNDEPLEVQLAPDIQLLNGQEIAGEVQEQADGSERERRYVGYLPGRALTLEGTWEGDDRFTARAAYGGAPADYVDYLASQPGMMVLYGLFCCVISLALVGVGGVMWVMGR
jgi:hypothetical protein